MKFEFDLDRNIVIEILTGDINLGELIEITKKLHQEPEYSPEMSAIIDLRESNLMLTHDDMWQFVNWLGTQKNRIRGYCAFITTTALTHGVSRMYSGMGEDLQDTIKYCSSQVEAIQWIEDMKSSKKSKE